MVSTGLSELRAVGTGGCASSKCPVALSLHPATSPSLPPHGGDVLAFSNPGGAEQPICSSARGGIYKPHASTHWSGLGTYHLGLPHLDIRANGEYGLDTLNAWSPPNDIAWGMSNVLIAATNATDPYQGMFGLAIFDTNFKINNNTALESPMQQAVHRFGWIPSYTYAYTAGAHYRTLPMRCSPCARQRRPPTLTDPAGGRPLSATLGGYDAARFVPHDNKFTLNPRQGIPRPLVRGIQVATANAQDKPSQWSSTTEILSNWNSSFTALVDSTTPYLWLPEMVCDRFADAFNLTYNSTFGLYTLTNDQYREFTSKNSLEFTFSLSSFDNNNDFGMPLEVPGVVNITLPLRAFVSLLQYPFAGEAIKYGYPAVPYFTLRRAPTNYFIIGRSFLQEAYLITEFDRSTYSIHQALFPPTNVTNLQLVKQPNNSPFPGPPPQKRGGLTTAQMAGIAVGVVLVCLAVLGACCYFRQRRRRRRPKGNVSEADDTKDTASTITTDLPRTPVSRILSKIARRGRSRRTAHDRGEVMTMPSEAPDCQIYELPAPVPPAELDGGNSDDPTVDEVEFGTDTAHDVSAYEIAQRKLDRQLQGPVPAYSPPTDGTCLSPEKDIVFGLASSETAQPMDQPSPESPMRWRVGDSNSNPFSASEPSPVSARTDWNSAGLPSPVTASMSSPSTPNGIMSHGRPAADGTHRSRSTNSAASASPVGDALPIPARASFQRVPIGPSRVVCLGPIPSNVQLPRQVATTTRVIGADGRSYPLPAFHTASAPSEGSLGSNYTDEEDMLVQELSRQAGMSQPMAHHSGQQVPLAGPANDRAVLSPHAGEAAREDMSPVSDSSSGHGRIDPRLHLIHVPQMAERRYSWEHD